MKPLLIIAIVVVSLVSVDLLNSPTAAQSKSRARPRGSICGNPQVACKTSATFSPNDLPFRVPQNSVIYDTELFYAIILKSVRAREDDCNTFVSEAERLETQRLFPDRKVFASRCVDIENLFYTNIDPNYRIMAVYGGTTQADANRVLANVKASGKFPRSYIRRMRTGFNGT